MELLDNPVPQMIYFWDNLPYEEKLTLSLLATFTKDRKTGLQPKTLLRRINKEKIPLSLELQDLQANLERLYHKEILIKEKLGSYRFRINLFRRWIGRDHSIWEVVHHHNR